MSPEHQGAQQQEQNTQRHLSRWLTEEEFRDGRISHERFMTFAKRRDVNIHAVYISSNSFGEYLFVTLSRGQHSESPQLTLHGLGYDKYQGGRLPLYDACMTAARKICD